MRATGTDDLLQLIEYQARARGGRCWFTRDRCSEPLGIHIEVDYALEPDDARAEHHHPGHRRGRRDRATARCCAGHLERPARIDPSVRVRARAGRLRSRPRLALAVGLRRHRIDGLRSGGREPAVVPDRRECRPSSTPIRSLGEALTIPTAGDEAETRFLLSVGRTDANSRSANCPSGSTRLGPPGHGSSRLPARSWTALESRCRTTHGRRPDVAAMAPTGPYRRALGRRGRNVRRRAASSCRADGSTPSSATASLPRAAPRIVGPSVPGRSRRPITRWARPEPIDASSSTDETGDSCPARLIALPGRPLVVGSSTRSVTAPSRSRARARTTPSSAGASTTAASRRR